MADEENGQMCDPDRRFADFVTRCTGALGLPDPTVRNDSYMFRVGDRWTELSFDAERATVTIAAVAVVLAPFEDVRADLVAAFNLHHLFNGGHALVLDEEQGVVRLCRTDRLAALRPQDIGAELRSFAQKVEAAGTWYLKARDAEDDRVQLSLSTRGARELRG